MKDLGFAFNDKDFSDRLLYVEIESNSKVEVKTLHINSAILAVDSPFFFKLFKNGMRESMEKHVTLRINASEEIALMDLLKFMYNNTLSATSATTLLNVLVIADKFEVTSCFNYCTKQLQAIPLSLESAILYVELPSNVLMDEVVSSLNESAKEYLVKTFRHFSITSIQKAMSLPLSALEVVLDSNHLRVDSEDYVYEFILKWARAHYPKLKERQEILTSLARFIYFPYLSMSTIKEIQVCPEFDTKEMSNLILESLYLNSGYPYGVQRLHLSRDAVTTTFTRRRSYEYFPVKVFEFESPKPCCVVYFFLRKKKLKNLIEMEEIYSDDLYIGGQMWSLYATYIKGNNANDEYLGLFVESNKDKGYMLDAELAVMDKKSQHEFRIIDIIENCTLEELRDIEGDCPGNPRMCGIPWATLMAKDSEYFINDILHL